MKDKERIQKLLSEHPEYRQTKLRYVAVSKLINETIEPEVCQKICSLNDALRHATDSDEIGYALEKTWHKSPELHTFENQLFKLPPITGC